ncbi:unnamed protein product [Merluccius merluccius]
MRHDLAYHTVVHRPHACPPLPETDPGASPTEPLSTVTYASILFHHHHHHHHHASATSRAAESPRPPLEGARKLLPAALPGRPVPAPPLQCPPVGAAEVSSGLDGVGQKPNLSAAAAAAALLSFSSAASSRTGSQGLGPLTRTPLPRCGPAVPDPFAADLFLFSPFSRDTPEVCDQYIPSG